MESMKETILPFISEELWKNIGKKISFPEVSKNWSIE